MKKQNLTHPLFSLLLACTQFVPVAASAAGRQDNAARPSTTQAGTPAPQSPASPPPQSTPAPPGTPVEPEDEVVRITSNLVQVDAVVTDKEGRQVTDLRPEDFEVLVDGKPQRITNFSYVSNESRTVTSARPAVDKTRVDKNGPPPPPPVRLRPEQVRRTMALVVDDLGTSFENMIFVRHALRKFVDEQMQPDDLVAVMRTSAGMGALQQFTSDKRLLYKAIEKVRWFPSGRSGVGSFAPARNGELPNADLGDLENFREESFTVGTLGAINFIVKGLRELPGRKSIVLFSDGFEIYKTADQDDSGNDHRGPLLLESLRRLIDQANRASVVIYTIDARGLPSLNVTAEDNLSASIAGETAGDISGSRRSRGGGGGGSAGPRGSAALARQIGSDRAAKYFATQDGLRYLADETGGLFVRATNDLAGGVTRALDDQKGYYLIGYRPDEETFKLIGGRTRFNTFQLRLKREGLKARTRSGFYGVADEGARPPAVRRTRLDQTLGAISSPFASGEVGLRLTSLYSDDAAKGAFVSSLMHIDMSKVKFADEPDGWHKAVIDVVALTFGENGSLVDQLNRTETLRARGETFDQLLRDGLIYMMRVPIKKPGAYQLRVAVRDAASEALGTASQFIEVPDITKNKLALSGIVVRGFVAGGNSSAAKPQAAAAEGQSSAPDPMSSPAVRRFRQNSDIELFFNVYNAKLDRAASAPQLQTQVRLFRDGQPVFSGKFMPLDAKGQTDLKRLGTGSRLHLGKELSPGEYVLQVVVQDALAPEKGGTVTQWIDFEIVG